MNDRRSAVADGGNPYVNETADGYLGVGKFSNSGVTFGVGMFPVEWDGETIVWAFEDPPGVALVDEEPEEYLARYQVSESGVGPGVHVGSRGLEPFDVEDGDDVRAYEREEGGILLVPADPDPLLEGSET